MNYVTRNHSLSRRQLLWSGGGTLASVLLRPFALLAEPGLLPTPAQTEGPFYPDVLPLDTDNDLVSIAGSKEHASGQITHIFGRLTDRDGQAVRHATIEIWQCDAMGRYLHTTDARRGRRDPYFQGYGKTLTDAQGGYHFRTIKPVPYPGRAPHIHFAIKGNGFERLTTQMYVDGAPENADDFLLQHIRNSAARRQLLVALQPRPELEPGALGGEFPIVLGDR